MRKVEFDARADPSPKSQDLYLDPWKYTFVHNFKVHYKASMLQALANKVDISISSASPQLPRAHQVIEEFDRRMQLGNISKNDRKRKSAISYHVTDVEYKESIALGNPEVITGSTSSARLRTLIRGESTAQLEGEPSCSQCGNRPPTSSKFCNMCGAPLSAA